MMDIETISAHIEIRQVLYRYCRGVDRGDEALLRRVYHPDATDDHGTWKGRGVDFAAYIVASLDRQQGVAQHHITNVLIELDGDAARVESYFVAFHPYPAQTADPAREDTAAGAAAGTAPGASERIAFVGGRYLDRFERRGGEWRISDRKVVLDWTREDLPGSGWSAHGQFERGGRRGADASSLLFD
jgi:hypothetical protein